MDDGFAFSPKNHKGEMPLNLALMTYYYSVLKGNGSTKFLILIPGFIVKAELNLDETDKINANGHIEYNLASIKPDS